MKESLVPNHKGQPCVRNFEHPDAEELTRFVRNIISEMGGDPDAPFKPCAYYDENMDVIRVLAVDCSVTESWISQTLTLCERTHLEDGQAKYIGFNIEGARHFCKTQGLRSSGTIKISELLKAMTLREIDPRAKGAIAQVAIPILEDNNLDEVEFP